MKTKIFLSVILILLVIGVYALVKEYQKPGRLDTFAMCLKDSGATFYGAFWCPHCQNQKKMFGKSAKLLPYVECSTPDGKGQLQICSDAKIGAYPTWIFSDGSRQDGEVSLKTLSEKTNCPLPETN